MTVYYKMRQMLLENAIILLQNATVVTKMRRFFYKMRQLSQDATFITNCDSIVHDVLCISKGFLVLDRDIHKVFSALNLIPSFPLVITPPIQCPF